jgi:hypothetical protein
LRNNYVREEQNMSEEETESKDFREAQVLDISQMSEEQKAHLVSYYLTRLAGYYRGAGDQLHASDNPLWHGLDNILARREQEVLTLRAHVNMVLQSRIGARMSQATSRSMGEDLIEDRRKNTELVETIQRALGILLRRWEGKHPLQATIVRSMQGLAHVLHGGLADVGD